MRAAPRRPTSARSDLLGGAPLVAAERADELLAAGEMDGRRVWLRIVKAVKVLLQREVPGGERVH